MNIQMYFDIQNFSEYLESSDLKMTWSLSYKESLLLNLIDLRDRLKNDLASDSFSGFEKVFLRGKLDAVHLVILKSKLYEEYNEGVIPDPKKVIESFFKYISPSYYKAKRSYEKGNNHFVSLRYLATCVELHQLFKDISKFYLSEGGELSEKEKNE